MAAAIALGARARAASASRSITIDPAPRLARALGFESSTASRSCVAGAGELWAMRLDPKRTLDD